MVVIIVSKDLEPIQNLYKECLPAITCGCIWQRYQSQYISKHIKNKKLKSFNKKAVSTFQNLLETNLMKNSKNIIKKVRTTDEVVQSKILGSKEGLRYEGLLRIPCYSKGN